MADNPFLSGLQIGASIGQGRVNARLRQQELQSADAERQIRERLLTQQIDAAKRKIDEDVAARADVSAAAQKAVLEMSMPGIPPLSCLQAPPPEPPKAPLLVNP
jgi:hypothetical protein